MNVQLRPFAPSDYEAAYSLWQRCEGVGLSDADSREGIERYLARNPGLSFVAESETRIVGSILGGHDGRRGYLHHLAVDPSARRRGIGRQLVDACLDALSREGISKCHLFVYDGNGLAKAFWEAAGWTLRTDVRLVSQQTCGC